MKYLNTFRPHTWLLHISMTVVLLVTISSCKQSNPAFDSLSQIEGTWVMRFDSAAVYEKWEKVNDTLYTGSSFEVSGGDSILTESLQIVSNDEGVFYIPTVTDQNDGKPVAFKMAEREGNIYVFENPQHDFPTNITYEFLPGNKLKATVSGLVNEEMRSLEFDFEKVK